MTEDLTKGLKEAIRHRIACIDKPTINGFAGTGRSRRRENACTHTIARRIVDEGLHPFSFFWNHGNGEPAGRTDVYLTVFTALFDIDDEDARRWTSNSEWDAARDEATREIVRALLRKFTVAKRRVIVDQVDRSVRGNGSPVGSHSLSNSRYEDDL